MTLRNTTKLWYILQHTNKGIGHNVSHLKFDFITNLFSFTKNLIMLGELASGFVQVAKMIEDQTLDPNKEYVSVSTSETGFYLGPTNEHYIEILDLFNYLTLNGFVYREKKIEAILHFLKRPNHLVFSKLREQTNTTVGDT